MTALADQSTMTPWPWWAWALALVVLLVVIGYRSPAPVAARPAVTTRKPCTTPACHYPGIVAMLDVATADTVMVCAGCADRGMAYGTLAAA